MLYITDNENASLKITDLDAAIKQATTFAGYKLSDDKYKELFVKQQAYWQDILNKLLKLKVA